MKYKIKITKNLNEHFVRSISYCDISFIITLWCPPSDQVALIRNFCIQLYVGLYVLGSPFWMTFSETPKITKN